MKHLLLALLFVTSSALAGNCDHVYVNNKQIAVQNTIELCSSFYAVAYSKDVKGPIVSFDRISAGKNSVRRNDAFRPDTRVSSRFRAELSDYKNSGYDRGHMTPAGDASTSAEMRDTFLLSNMTPQSSRLNRNAWKNLEMRVRTAASTKGAYVATIAVYGNQKLGMNEVGIPIRYYKVVWYPGVTKAYFADNIDSALVLETSVNRVNAETRLNLPK